MSKILVTGATGSLGANVINFLLKRTDASNISTLVRNISKTEYLKEKGIDVREGDYDNYDSLLNAFTGIDKLYFISGNDVANRTQQHERVIKAAKESKIKHVVYTSFQRKNETETSPIAMVAEAHVKTEKWLKESGVAYTILKHNLYMDLLPPFLGEKVLETGLIYLPAGDGKIAFALREDMAEVASVILTSQVHENKEYNISSNESYSYKEIASVLSELTGETISYMSPSQEEFAKTLSDAGVPTEIIGMLAAFNEAIKQGEFAETSNTIEMILGRKPVTLRDFLKKSYRP